MIEDAVSKLEILRGLNHKDIYYASAAIESCLENGLAGVNINPIDCVDLENFEFLPEIYVNVDNFLRGYLDNDSRLFIAQTLLNNPIAGYNLSIRYESLNENMLSYLIEDIKNIGALGKKIRIIADLKYLEAASFTQILEITDSLSEITELVLGFSTSFDPAYLKYLDKIKLSRAPSLFCVRIKSQDFEQINLSKYKRVLLSTKNIEDLIN